MTHHNESEPEIPASELHKIRNTWDAQNWLRKQSELDENRRATRTDPVKELRRADADQEVGRLTRSMASAVSFNNKRRRLLDQADLEPDRDAVKACRRPSVFSHQVAGATPEASSVTEDATNSTHGFGNKLNGPEAGMSVTQCAPQS